MQACDAISKLGVCLVINDFYCIISVAVIVKRSGIQSVYFDGSDSPKLLRQHLVELSACFVLILCIIAVCQILSTFGGY
jgi:hypothetical protein